MFRNLEGEVNNRFIKQFTSSAELLELKQQDIVSLCNKVSLLCARFLRG